jgi:polysaccharide deacetylase family protein (PEP-CTERM system associated)
MSEEGSTKKEASTHILSVDVEDYFMVEAFAGSVSRDSWESRPSRVDTCTRRVLDHFDKHNVKGTFFFVGWVAQKFPELVREVHLRGHELACHSYWHRPIYILTPQEFRADTRRAKDAIEQAAGVTVIGYRAPSWSITSVCLWALEVLAEEGFLYDSSIYPIHHDLYGMPSGERFAHVHDCGQGQQIWEFPPTTVRLLGLNVPAAGGGYLRIFPMAYTRWAFRHIESNYGQPVVLYFHPWEVDPDQPRITDKIKSQIRHYTNLSHMEQRLTVLLTEYEFQPVSAAMARMAETSSKLATQALRDHPSATIGSEYEARASRA